MTSQYQKAKQAVDYASGILLYDNFDMIRRVVQKIKKTDDLIKLTNALEAFVKRIFEHHVTNCDITKTNFSLEGTSLYCNACDVCALPHRVIKYLKDNVDPDHHQVLEDFQTKAVLYQGHHIRVANQKNVINEYLHNLADDQAYLIMDFKMKF